MTEGDLNPRPESFDGGRADERRYDKGGITAGKVVNWLVLVLVLVALGFLAYGAARAFFPRWWADQVGAQVGGSRWHGLAYGAGVGAVFTFVPLLILGQIRRGFFNWTWRLIVALVAIGLAVPNWLTVAVAVGTSSAAEVGRTTMTAEAPGFRNGSAAGAIAGLVLWLIVLGTSLRLGHQRKKVRELRGRVSELEKRGFADAGADRGGFHHDAPEAPDERVLDELRDLPDPHEHRLHDDN